MTEITQSILERGDLAHLALFLWAGAASYLALKLLKALNEASRRFELFLRELARFNQNFSGGGR